MHAFFPVLSHRDNLQPHPLITSPYYIIPETTASSGAASKQLSMALMYLKDAAERAMALTKQTPPPTEAGQEPRGDRLMTQQQQEVLSRPAAKPHPASAVAADLSARCSLQFASWCTRLCHEREPLQPTADATAGALTVHPPLLPDTLTQLNTQGGW